MPLCLCPFPTEVLVRGVRLSCEVRPGEGTARVAGVVVGLGCRFRGRCKRYLLTLLGESTHKTTVNC